MESIDRIRKLFVRTSGEESKISDLLTKILYKIDDRKNGTIIGKKQDLDYEELFYTTNFPKSMSDEEDVLEKLVKLYEGVSLWGHPLVQSNVIPPPTTISIIAASLAARYNENSIWDHYGMSAAKSEVMAVGMLADLIGFDKKKAGGIFTFGGTGCNLYAARIGIEKADPDAKYTGIRDRIHFFCSDVSHYSIKSSAIWTGIGLDNIKVISSDDDNTMVVDELEAEINKTIESGARVGTIFATMGTTDAFGIDSLKSMVELRDRIEKQVGYKIHIHADAVIGWPYLTFKNDDAVKGLTKDLQSEIRSIVSKISDLQYADSVGIDFHKTGWGPYLCSAFIVKNKDDLLLLEKFKKDMPYLYHGDGYQPGTFTLESSRPNYAQKALVNMMAFGKDGYESLIVHLLSMADYLRIKIDESPDITLLNKHNPAFVTDFRFYPETKYDTDGELFFEKELHDRVPAEFTEKINRYNNEIAEYVLKQAESGGTPIISYTDSYKTTKEKRMLMGIKSYPMSPFTEKSDMNTMLEHLYRAKEYIDSKGEF